MHPYVFCKKWNRNLYSIPENSPCMTEEVLLIMKDERDTLDLDSKILLNPLPWMTRLENIIGRGSQY